MRLTPTQVSLEQLLASGCELQTEEKYLLSRLHTTIAAVDAAFAKYNVNEVAGIVEDFLLGTLSHTYLQLVWEKSASGSEEGSHSRMAWAHILPS